MARIVGFAASVWLICGMTQAALAEEAGKGAQPEPASIQQGVALVKAGRHAEAITKYLDPIIATLPATPEAAQASALVTSRIPASKGARLYCSPSKEEAILYSMAAAAENKHAVVINGLWCEALYLKGFALISLKKFAEAEPLIRRAVELAPENAKYLSELGHIQQFKKDWPEAIATFMRAGKAANGFPSQAGAKMFESRACRGVGFSQIEQRKLDEAEATYQRCLGIDANDAIARHELRYIQSLKSGPTKD